MNEGINNVVEFIKESIENDNGSNYFIRLKENAIELLSGNRAINTFNIGKNLRMLDFIRDTCNGVLKALPIEEVGCLITLESFSGAVATPLNSPIQVFFEMKDGNVLLLSFTSCIDKDLEWLNDYVYYRGSHSKNDAEYNEFDELNEYIEYLDNGGYKQEGQKK